MTRDSGYWLIFSCIITARCASIYIITAGSCSQCPAEQGQRNWGKLTPLNLRSCYLESVILSIALMFNVLDNIKHNFTLKKGKEIKTKEVMVICIID